MGLTAGTVLWWGRFDPDYSRNRILRQAYAALGWRVVDFHPALSALGDVEALLRRLPRTDLIHVPCFRQRDLAAAARYARRRAIPLLFDPLISAYDKQVFERAKFPEESAKARRLLKWERALFDCADIVLADTTEHARFFHETFGVPHERLHVVYVGAEESLFFPETHPHPPNDPIELLFYGSFIPLQGPEAIVEAARLYQGPPVRWVLLGDGPLRKKCEALAAGLNNVTFDDWIPYRELPDRIRRADILLGVFGTTPKAQRVIPNKVFQALACGKPVVTCTTPAYPTGSSDTKNCEIRWVPAGNPTAITDAISTLATHPQILVELGIKSRACYEEFFSKNKLKDQLYAALVTLTPVTPESHPNNYSSDS